MVPEFLLNLTGYSFVVIGSIIGLSISILVILGIFIKELKSGNVW